MNDDTHPALPSIISMVRWGARILSALTLLFWSFFIVAHLVGDEGRASRPLNTGDYISLTTMGISLAGLGVAWKWERIGGAMTLVAVSIIAVANWKILTSLIAIIPITAILFLLCGWMSSTQMERQREIPM
jgi:hypothetical protein